MGSSLEAERGVSQNRPIYKSTSTKTIAGTIKFSNLNPYKPGSQLKSRRISNQLAYNQDLLLLQQLRDTLQAKVARVLRPGTYKLANEKGEILNNAWNIEQLHRFYP